MRDGLERRHRIVEARPADDQQGRDRDDGEPEVEHPQPPSRLADRHGQALDLGQARELGLQQLPTADAQPREDGDCQNDDPHTAEPLGELPPMRSDSSTPSISVRIVAPVAVNPDTASKYAFIGFAN